MDGKEQRPVVQQAMEIHAAHVNANGTGGHTEPAEWRNCQQEDCVAFRDSISSPTLNTPQGTPKE